VGGGRSKDVEDLLQDKENSDEDESQDNDEVNQKHFDIEDVADMGIVKAPEVLLHIPNLVDLRRKQESNDLLKIIKSIESELGEGKVFSPFLNKAGLVKSLSSRKSVFDFKTQEFSELQEKFSGVAKKIEEWSYEHI
jgi:chromosome partitioning protein